MKPLFPTALMALETMEVPSEGGIGSMAGSCGAANADGVYQGGCLVTSIPAGVEIRGNHGGKGVAGDAGIEDAETGRAGGGAGGPGGDSYLSGIYAGGAGGTYAASSISGKSYGYAAGGKGGLWHKKSALTIGATATRIGGGGGSNSNDGGHGKAGTVIVRWPCP